MRFCRPEWLYKAFANPLLFILYTDGVQPDGKRHFTEKPRAGHTRPLQHPSGSYYNANGANFNHISCATPCGSTPVW